MRRRDVGPAIPSAGLRSATYRPPRPGSLRMTATPADASVADFDPADPASYSFWTEERLRYADLDPLSHVNNNAIGVFLENGRVYLRSEEHTSELQSLMRNSYAVLCLKKKKQYHTTKK